MITLTLKQSVCIVLFVFRKRWLEKDQNTVMIAARWVYSDFCFLLYVYFFHFSTKPNVNLRLRCQEKYVSTFKWFF